MEMPETPAKPIRIHAALRQALQEYNDRLCTAVGKGLWITAGPMQVRRLRRLLKRANTLRQCDVSAAMRLGKPPPKRKSAGAHYYTAECEVPECPACTLWKYHTRQLLSPLMLDTIEHCPAIQHITLDHRLMACKGVGLIEMDNAMFRLKQRVYLLYPALKAYFLGSYFRWEIAPARVREGTSQAGINLHLHVIGQPHRHFLTPGRREDRLKAQRALEAAWTGTMDVDEKERERVHFTQVLRSGIRKHVLFRYLCGVAGEEVKHPKMLAGLYGEFSGKRPRIPGVTPEQLACIIMAHEFEFITDPWRDGWNTRSRVFRATRIWEPKSSGRKRQAISEENELQATSDSVARAEAT